VEVCAGYVHGSPMSTGGANADETMFLIDLVEGKAETMTEITSRVGVRSIR
jgi:hypothetical protein